MYYELYLDSYFLMNLILNWFALSRTAGLLPYRRGKAARFIAAFTGAACSCVIVLIPHIPGILKLLAGPFAISSVMIGIAFSMQNFKHFMKTMLLLYGMMFGIGGALLWLQNCFRAVTGKGFSLPLLFLTAWAVSEMLGRLLQYVKQRRERQIVTVQLEEGGRTVSLRGLVDTGNSLKEPFSGKPVCVIQKSSVESILNQNRLEEFPERRRMIPYHSVGKAHGMMEGYVVERMAVCMEGADLVIKGAVIGISEQCISTENAYQMILNPAILHGRE